jgi:hypothetical protein
LKRFAVLVALVLILPFAAARARAAIAPQDGAKPAAEAEAEGPLQIAMETIEENLGRLRRALREDADVPEALAAVAAMQEATLRAKLLEPPLAAKIPEAERPAFLRDFRKLLIRLATAQLALETALLDGDLESARALFKEVRAFEDQGHERFTEED